MQGPLYLLLVRLGVPATVAAAIVGAAMLLMGCAGESYTLTRAPNTVTVPSVSVPSPVYSPVPAAVPQK